MDTANYNFIAYPQTTGLDFLPDRNQRMIHGIESIFMLTIGLKMGFRIKHRHCSGDRADIFIETCVESFVEYSDKIGRNSNQIIIEDFHAYL